MKLEKNGKVWGRDREVEFHSIWRMAEMKFEFCEAIL